MNDLVRYEQPELCALLERIDLDGTTQERMLTAMLRDCAREIRQSATPQLVRVFRKTSGNHADFGVLSEADRHDFENLLAGLGRTGMQEQLRLIACADERLREREVELRRETACRAKLIRTLGLTGGAAAFLVLI